MNFRKWRFGFSLALILIWGLPPTVASAAAVTELNSSPHADLHLHIAAIRTESDPIKRGDRSLDMLRFVQSDRIDKYSDSEIDEIADLLNDENGAVISWTALTLARIGPDARRAAPILQKVRLREECWLKKHPVPRRTQTDIFPLETAMFQLNVSTLPIVCIGD